MFSRARSALGTWALTWTRTSPWLLWSAPSLSLSPQWREGRQPATTTLTGAEDRATLASDPSADCGGNGMGRLALSRPPSHSFPTKALNAPSPHQRLDE